MAVSFASIAQAQTSGTWAADVGTTGGNWSSAANWAGGTVADSGGTATFTTLPTFTTAPINIVQDLPTATVSRLNFDTFITYLIRSPSAGTNSLTMSGPGVVTTSTQSINTLNATVFGHQLQIPVAGSVGLTKNGPGTLTLWQPNTFTGNVQVNGGILVARQFGDSVFGALANDVVLNDGTIRVTTGAWSSARTINLLGNGTIEASTTGTTTWAGTVIGAGNLNKIGSRGLTMTAANSYSGATNLLAGSIGLSGNGQISQTSALTARDSIVLDNSTTNLTNRVNDMAPLTLQGASLALTGGASAASSETFGATTFSRGTTMVTATPGAGQSAAIITGNVSRDTGGTAFFRGTSLGSALGANVANVTFGTSPTLVGGGGAAGSTNISIIPWAFGNTNATAAANNATNSFVTYSANGIRPLDTSTEYINNFFSVVGTTTNVRLIAAESVLSPTTINSLIITGSGLVSGPGPLTIGSGAIMNLNIAQINVPIDFGTAEGIIQAPTTITFNSTISGSGGLTKQGAGTAIFANATSTYTGTTIIGGGTAFFGGSVPSGSPSYFGSDTSAIVLAPAGVGTGGTTARLAFNGAGSASFDRNLLVTGRIALNNSATLPGFGVASASTLNMNGNITLDASPLMLLTVSGAPNGLVINGNITGDGGPVTDGTGGGVITLNGNNTFTGGIEMANATWEVGSDTAFGTGMIKAVQTSGQPTIRAVGGPRIVPNQAVAFSFSANYWQIAGSQPITFTGSINLSGSYTHNINNSALTTYAGVLHTGGFTKAGTGVLLLSGDNIYTGTTTISSGVLRISHANALGSVQAPTVVANGAALEVTGDALSSEPLTINGTGIGFNGALNNVSGINSLGNVSVASDALVKVTNGALAVGNISAGDGTQGLTKDGNGILTARRVRVGPLSVATSTLRIAPGADNDKTSSVTGIIIFGTGAKLDLGDNDLIDDYTGATILPALQSQLASGYNGGAWNGTAITTSLGDPVNHALGYADNSVLQVGSFSGQTVDTTSVLIKYTYYGDSDLDGDVDVGDLGNLASNWQTAGPWTSGDFDYNGTIDVNDLGLLASNWQAGVGNPLGPSLSEALASIGLPNVSVPEPATGVLLLATAALKCHRRRHR
jgi:autotransporter-associated beta strand protein